MYLKGGGQVTGQIVEQSDESVTVNIGSGTMSVRMASIVRIETDVSPIQEYQARAAAIPSGDAEAWRGSGTVGNGQGLATSPVRRIRVVAIVAGRPEANRALGRVRYDGGGLPRQESYRARGFVEFEGEWMTPGEQQSILEERRPATKQIASRRRPEFRPTRRRTRERKAREDEDREEFLRGGLPQHGDRNWGWGYGPTYWPTSGSTRRAYEPSREGR